MANPTQQTINVGAVANDGTGESLRDAFNAVNNNFANVWAAGPVGTNVVVRNNEVTTNVTNLDLKIAGNGVGNVVVASTLRPTYDGVYDLGTANYQWAEAHAQYYYGNGRFLSGVVTTTGFSAIDANGVVISSNANTTVNFTASNNLSITGNANTSTVNFAVSENPTFANVTATNFGGVALAVSDATIYGNLAGINANFTGSATANTANIGNLGFQGSTVSTTVANADIVLSTTGTGVVSATGNIVAPNFIGNVVGNISGNIAAPGTNTEVIFNDNNTANAVPGFTFNKSNNALSLSGNVTASALNGAGYGIGYALVDRGGDTSNWNVLLQMGTYTVNRLNWGGVTGAPLDSLVYVGLLEVKIANTQGSVQSVSQVFYPGTVDNNNVKIQWNRNYWNGSWTQWIKMTNDGQSIDGGSF